MTTARQDRLWDLLTRDTRWTTAAALAVRLGVTTRSIRSYVTAINARTPGAEIIESGPLGYRARPGAHAVPGSEPDTSPQQRQLLIIRELVDAEDGVDVFDLADRLFVSSATVDADLGRIRARVVDDHLALERTGARVRIAGTEGAKRRLVARLVEDDSAIGYDRAALEDTVGHDLVAAMPSLRRELGAVLSADGFFVNEYALAGIAVEIVVAAHRVRQGNLAVAPDGEAEGTLGPVIGELARDLLDVHLPTAERIRLTALVRTRGAAAPTAEASVMPEADVERAVREVLDEVCHTYGVDGLDDDFVARLALHVQNLRHRSEGGDVSRNPLTRTLKASYPLLFEVSVAVAAGLQDRLGTPVHDDEIAYLAMHIGGQWERRRTRANRLTVTLVCPGYYELHELLRTSVARTLGATVQIADVRTELDPTWDDITTDLVLTTIAPPAPKPSIVQIQPFLTDIDVEHVMTAAAHVRRTRRLARLRAELGRYFVPGAFVRPVDGAAGEEGVIRQLGERLRAAGVVDDGYVDNAVRRESLSSTAFTPTLAVPHALGMQASRTAIAVGIAEPPVRWGDERVQVIALVAFSETDQQAFQAVFEQFVEVFTDPGSAQRLVRRAVDLPSFLDELAAVIDG